MTHNQELTITEDHRADKRLRSKKIDPFDITDTDVFFAKERYKLHLATPDEGVSIDILKKYFVKKYGF